MILIPVIFEREVIEKNLVVHCHFDIAIVFDRRRYVEARARMGSIVFLPNDFYDVQIIALIAYIRS